VSYSLDFTNPNAAHWLEWLGRFKDQECRGLEIGCFEGRTSNWFVENILTHPLSRLVCVDPFCAGETLPEAAGDDLFERFTENTKPNASKIQVSRGPSAEKLPVIIVNCWLFDFIYVDGSHTADNVLLDAVLAYQLCRVGGIIILDDYPWGWDRPEHLKPRVAIDAFLACYDAHLKLIHKEWQVVVERLS
jgi:hypothetical protein